MNIHVSIYITIPHDDQLLICTSEILRNKLVKASGIQATQFFPPAPNSMTTMLASDNDSGMDVDLERLGCVVSDEIHYINDVERGSVWEETLMHLPADVQMVALSATLREPEKFVNWIETTRK
jgi:ATP-dependent RNA helicase HelY